MNGYNFTDRVRKVLQLAREEAARLRHEYVGTEHILLGLIKEGEGVAVAVLTNLRVDPAKVCEWIEDMVKKGPESRQNTGPDLPYTSRAKKILELSTSAARELHNAYVGTEHLLLGVLREEKGLGAEALSAHGVTLEMARAEVRRLVGEHYLDSATGEPELDQRFKTTIGLLELHRLRFGSYPESLGDLRFLGANDSRALDSMRYEKLADGYRLDVVTPSGATPRLIYPAEFWAGLGIRRTNVVTLPLIL